jgi:hypothetical protein
MAFSTTGKKRQHRIQAIQHLNGGLLIHAEHCRMPRWIQVQADDIGGLRFKVRIVAGHLTLQPMRQQSGLFRGAMRSVFADTPACGDSSVDPSDGLLRVVDKILARKAGVNTLANWPA